ncbi:response regulator transcription factor [Patescibacteria group bacterium]|nr:response regulator transcription factor [Patescibacteria group bacterium]
MRILLIEDDRRLSTVIVKGLVEDGFAVDTAYDGEEGEYLAGSEPYDLIILDLMLPKKDGISVTRNLREKGVRTPVLILTARSEIGDKVKGLDAGADDYMVKPFSFLELRSRIHALMRRDGTDRSPVLRLDTLEVNPLEHTVRRTGRTISLTPKEFAVLELLMRHKDEAVTRTMITEHVWDYNFDSFSNVVDVFVSTLRKKIDRGSVKKLIHTVHGVGYKIGTSA